MKKMFSFTRIAERSKCDRGFIDSEKCKCDHPEDSSTPRNVNVISWKLVCPVFLQPLLRGKHRGKVMFSVRAITVYSVGRN